MYAAPPMSVAVTRSRQQAVLMFFLAMLSWALWSSWALSSGTQHGSVQLHGILTLLMNGAFLAYWVFSSRGTLSWDGANWDWCPHRSGVGTNRLTGVEVGLDWQRGQLLRLRRPGAITWIWLDAAMAGDRWSDFRRATALEAGRRRRSRDQGMQL